MKITVKENISWRQVGDEVLILDTRYQKKSHALNPVAAYIWVQLNQGLSYHGILSGILEEFDIDRDQAENDLKEFLVELSDNGLVILKNE